MPSARKPYQIGLTFTRKNGDVGAISVTERSCAAPISKDESHAHIVKAFILYRILFVVPRKAMRYCGNTVPAISVTERSCAAPISKDESHAHIVKAFILYRILFVVPRKAMRYCGNTASIY